MNDKIELRVTRCGHYHPNTPLLSREGHYIRGANIDEAKQRAKDKFPGEELTFNIWKQWDENHEQVTVNRELSV